MYFSASHLTLAIALATPLASGHTLLTRGKPSDRDWASLNSTVGGRLAAGVPWSKPCFTKFNSLAATPDANECSFVQQNTFNSHTNRSDFFGTSMSTQWETCMSSGDQCALDWQTPSNKAAFAPPAQCMQGSIPSYYIDVKGQADIVAAFKFTKQTGVPLVIKNSGHDFQGRSVAPGSLALWMHHMKQISHDPKFVPDGCPAHSNSMSAVTLGAGQQWAEVYKFADDNDLIVIGGSDQSVGAAGGWVLGGGHSPLSSTYGMGVDRTLQFKVVTPDGQLRTVNACQNQDLFFALRGGGGGTFGVVLEVTMVASPKTTFRAANINWNVSDANYAKVLKVFIDNATTFATQGWGGYITPSAGNAIFINSKLNQAQAEASMKSLLDITKNMGAISNVTQMDTFFEWFQELAAGRSGSQDPVGLPVALTSRLVPQKNHATAASRAQLLDAILTGAKNTFTSQILFSTPFGYTGPKQDTSVPEFWKTSLYQVMMVNTWNWNSTLADKKDAYAKSTKAISVLRDITPGSGAYHNEADIHEPNHEVSFWGTNYNRLVQIKRKYDPNHLLDCWHCVDSKGPKDPRFSCYI